MIQIRPVTDLQNDYASIEKEVLDSDETMYLTKNGYGSMVMMSLEKYTQLTDKSNHLISSETNGNTRKEHIEIISRPKRVVDDDDE
ncbi:MAG: type II toxin-antitoxin system Phd/YefM family antitoxin [Clostridia bacterium]|nr:type II toxin-antitoxin system Phd/YefM family antitoxin [Clostridia bacterium]